MNPRFEELLYRSGLTAQGCWDELDEYARQGIIKFGELVVLESARKIDEMIDREWYEHLKQHFGLNRVTETNYLIDVTNGTPAGNIAPTITTVTLPPAIVGLPYNAKLSATGTGQIIWSETLCIPPTITTVALPPAIVGLPYNTELSATGTGQIIWTSISA